MVDDLIGGISNALYDTFKFPIYTEKVEQSFKPPCFFISVTNYMYTPELTNSRFARDREHYMFSITFFPEETKSIGEQIRKFLKKITKSLKYIEFKGKKKRVDNFSYKLYDQILYVFISFDLLTFERNKGLIMEKLERKGGVRNGKS